MTYFDPTYFGDGYFGQAAAFPGIPAPSLPNANPYFNCDYFDPTYFETGDCNQATGDGHPPKRRRPLLLMSEPAQTEDEAFLVWFN